MSKSLKPSRTIVVPRASRIRREPPPQEKEKFWLSQEWEQRLAVLGILLFAVALALIWLGIGYLTAGDGAPPTEIRLTVADPT
jgi:hypothetical protein